MRLHNISCNSIMSLFTAVPTGYVLTSGANSALTWTNAVSVSSMNVSSLGASALSVSTLTTSSSVSASTLTVSSITANSVGYSTLSGSTINATRLNYSSIVGSSISSNSMTLSLTAVSTQNTQIYQVATTNPTTSYTAIQASHVSTGTTYNALVINPSGGNVGVGTTTPAATLHVLNPTLQAGNTAMVTAQIIGRPPTGGLQNAMSGGFAIGAANAGINSVGRMDLMVVGAAAAGNSFGLVPDVPVATFLGSGNVGIGTTAPLYQFQVRSGAGGATASTIPATTIGSFVRSMGYVTSDRVDIEIGSSATDIGDIGCTYKYRLGMAGTGTTIGATFQISGVAITGSYSGTDAVSTRFQIAPNGTIFFNAYTAAGTLSILNSSGQIGASSDRRIKENIVYQSDTQQGLASVLNLKPATFNMIGSSDSHLGFIAQDLEQEIPLAVDGKKYEWQWEMTEDNKPKFDANGDIVYKLDADGNKIVRPRGVSDRAIIATQTLAIQELASRATSQAALVQELSKKLTAAEQQLAAKSAALDALIAWAQTQGYSVGA